MSWLGVHPSAYTRACSLFHTHTGTRWFLRPYFQHRVESGRFGQHFSSPFTAFLACYRNFIVSVIA